MLKKSPITKCFNALKKKVEGLFDEGDEKLFEYHMPAATVSKEKAEVSLHIMQPGTV
jgi:hypothetical protein